MVLLLPFVIHEKRISEVVSPASMWPTPSKQRSDNSRPQTTVSVVKPLGAQWLIRLFDYFKDIICNGFQFIKNYLEK